MSQEGKKKKEPRQVLRRKQTGQFNRFTGRHYSGQSPVLPLMYIPVKIGQAWDEGLCISYRLQGLLLLHKPHFWITKALWFLCTGGSQSVVTRPAAPASPKNLWEMQILRPHAKLTESEASSQASSWHFNQPSSWFWCPLNPKTVVTGHILRLRSTQNVASLNWNMLKCKSHTRLQGLEKNVKTSY